MPGDEGKMADTLFMHGIQSIEVGNMEKDTTSEGETFTYKKVTVYKKDGTKVTFHLFFD